MNACGKNGRLHKKKKKSLCNVAEVILNEDLILIYYCLAHDLESAAIESSGSMSRD